MGARNQANRNAGALHHQFGKGKAQPRAVLALLAEPGSLVLRQGTRRSSPSLDPPGEIDARVPPVHLIE